MFSLQDSVKENIFDSILSELETQQSADLSISYYAIGGLFVGFVIVLVFYYVLRLRKEYRITYAFNDFYIWIRSLLPRRQYRVNFGYIPFSMRGNILHRIKRTLRRFTKRY